MLKRAAIMIVISILLTGLSLFPFLSADRIDTVAELPVEPVEHSNLVEPTDNHPEIQPAEDSGELVAHLVATDFGFRIEWDHEQYPYVVGTVSVPDFVVHAVKRSSLNRNGSVEGEWIDAVVVDPEAKSVRIYPMYGNAMEYGQSNISLFERIDPDHIMFLRRTIEDDKFVYDLAKMNVRSGEISLIATRIWVVDYEQHYSEADFLLGSRYNPEIGKLLLTSYRGQLWDIDTATGETNHYEGLFHAIGDPGSMPPREIVFPSPDLERLVYRQGKIMELTNQFQVYRVQGAEKINQFELEDRQISSSPEIVWNEDGSLFAMEVASPVNEMSIHYDNSSYLFAELIQFYNRDGVMVRKLSVSDPSNHRLSVFGWAVGSKIWLEDYSPHGVDDRGVTEWFKGDITYKLYDIKAGRSVSYRTVSDLKELQDPIIVRSYNGLQYDSAPFLIVDMKSRLVWEAPKKSWAIYSNEQLYTQIVSDDAGDIYRWDGKDRDWEWLLAEPGEVTWMGDRYFNVPKVHLDRWLIYANKVGIDYYDTGN